MAKKSLKRYHNTIYFPEEWKESASTFCEKIIQKGPLTLSVHAVEKLMEISHLFGTDFVAEYLKIFKSKILSRDNIFEFYWYRWGSMYKACFRNRIGEYPVDLITVISESGNVVTIFYTHRGDSHTTLNKKLYEKGVTNGTEKRRTNT